MQGNQQVNFTDYFSEFMKMLKTEQYTSKQCSVISFIFILNPVILIEIWMGRLPEFGSKVIDITYKQS